MTLARLQKWYTSQCDGDWEHSYGVAIDTLDNPGWSVKIDLAETLLKDRPFATIKVERTATDWLSASRDETTFKGFCGPENLEECLKVFCDWAET